MKNMMKIYVCVLTALFISSYFFGTTVSAKENVEYDNKRITDEVKAYEDLAEKYRSTDLDDAEFVQQYEEVSVEDIPVTDEVLSAVKCLKDGDIDNDAKHSVSLKRLTIKNNEESSLYVLTAEFKTSSGSTERDGVTLSGSIYWFDYFGTNNVLNYVSGTRLGNITGSATYAYGGKYSIYKFGTFSGNGFTDWDYNGSEDFSFHLNISTSTNSGSTVSLTVNTSIFD